MIVLSSLTLRGSWCDLGFMPYAACHDLQNALLERVASGQHESTLLYVEHPPVLTLGAAFHEEHLRSTRERILASGIQIEPTDRGGDVTYHGPRQLVGYPVFELKSLGSDLHKWLRGLEETVMLTLREFGLEGRRFPPHTGVWIGDAKVCAIGIKVRRWVSKHGIALNCDNDLSPFDRIVPCGIQGYGVTSLTQALGRPVGPEQVKPVLTRAFEAVFGIELAQMSPTTLRQRLNSEL